jgi:hypothetical protein
MAPNAEAKKEESRVGMRIDVHPSSSRGRTSEHWLESHHSFSFNKWRDPSRMGFGALRVINEDFIAPHAGFGAHGHQDMEIVTIVLSGELTHQDSAGGRGTLRKGDVQRMSAGSGVMHSELNMHDDPVHLLQIWIEPKQRGMPSSYEQSGFVIARNRFTSIVDGTHGRRIDGALYMHQHAKISFAHLDAKMSAEYRPREGSGCYMMLITGQLVIEGETLGSGDAAAIIGAEAIDMTATEESKVLVIEVQYESSSLS